MSKRKPNYRFYIMQRADVNISYSMLVGYFVRIMDIISLSRPNHFSLEIMCSVVRGF